VSLTIMPAGAHAVCGYVERQRPSEPLVSGNLRTPLLGSPEDNFWRPFTRISYTAIFPPSRSFHCGCSGAETGLSVARALPFDPC
jgi:hypothetical protein